MADVGKDEAVTSPSHVLTVRWDEEDWQRIVEAAKALSDREHFAVTPTDVVRSGAIRRANEILGGHEPGA